MSFARRKYSSARLRSPARVSPFAARSKRSPSSRCKSSIAPRERAASVGASRSNARKPISRIAATRSQTSGGSSESLGHRSRHLRRRSRSGASDRSSSSSAPPASASARASALARLPRDPPRAPTRRARASLAAAAASSSSERLPRARRRRVRPEPTRAEGSTRARDLRDRRVFGAVEKTRGGDFDAELFLDELSPLAVADDVFQRRRLVKPQHRADRGAEFSAPGRGARDRALVHVFARSQPGDGARAGEADARGGVVERALPLALPYDVRDFRPLAEALITSQLLALPHPPLRAAAFRVAARETVVEERVVYFRRRPRVVFELRLERRGRPRVVRERAARAQPRRAVVAVRAVKPRERAPQRVRDGFDARARAARLFLLRRRVVVRGVVRVALGRDRGVVQRARFQGDDPGGEAPAIERRGAHDVRVHARAGVRCHGRRLGEKSGDGGADFLPERSFRRGRRGRRARAFFPTLRGGGGGGGALALGRFRGGVVRGQRRSRERGDERRRRRRVARRQRRERIEQRGRRHALHVRELARAVLPNERHGVLASPRALALRASTAFRRAVVRRRGVVVRGHVPRDGLPAAAGGRGAARRRLRGDPEDAASREVPRVQHRAAAGVEDGLAALRAHRVATQPRGELRLRRADAEAAAAAAAATTRGIRRQRARSELRRERVAEHPGRGRRHHHPRRAAFRFQRRRARDSRRRRERRTLEARERRRRAASDAERALRGLTRVELRREQRQHRQRRALPRGVYFRVVKFALHEIVLAHRVAVGVARSRDGEDDPARGGEPGRRGRRRRGRGRGLGRGRELAQRGAEPFPEIARGGAAGAAARGVAAGQSRVQVREHGGARRDRGGGLSDVSPQRARQRRADRGVIRQRRHRGGDGDAQLRVRVLHRRVRARPERVFDAFHAFTPRARVDLLPVGPPRRLRGETRQRRG
eukprot:31354-Pelagococcus_subviridis.AAC.15